MCWRYGYVETNQEALARRNSCTERSIRKYTSELVKKGLIAAIRQGNGKSYVYLINDYFYLKRLKQISRHVYDRYLNHKDKADKSLRSGLPSKEQIGLSVPVWGRQIGLYVPVWNKQTGKQIGLSVPVCTYIYNRINRIINTHTHNSYVASRSQAPNDCEVESLVCEIGEGNLAHKMNEIDKCSDFDSVKKMQVIDSKGKIAHNTSDNKDNRKGLPELSETLFMSLCENYDSPIGEKPAALAEFKKLIKLENNPQEFTDKLIQAAKNHKRRVDSVGWPKMAYLKKWLAEKKYEDYLPKKAIAKKTYPKPIYENPQWNNFNGKVNAPHHKNCKCEQCDKTGQI